MKVRRSRPYASGPDRSRRQGRIHGLGRRCSRGSRGADRGCRRVGCGGGLETTSGWWALRSLRSIAAMTARGAVAIIGAEKTRPAAPLHTGHGACTGAQPTPVRMSNTPSLEQRYSNVATRSHSPEGLRQICPAPPESAPPRRQLVKCDRLGGDRARRRGAAAPRPDRILSLKHTDAQVSGLTAAAASAPGALTSFPAGNSFHWKERSEPVRVIGPLAARRQGAVPHLHGKDRVARGVSEVVSGARTMHLVSEAH